MQRSTVHLILYACNITPLLAGVLGLLYIKKVDKRLFSFNLFLIFNAIVEFLQLIILNVSKYHHLFLFTIDVPIEFTLLAYFYYSFLKQYLNKKTFFFSVIIFNAFSILNSIFIQPIDTFNSYAIVGEAIIIIILSIFAFIVLLDPRSGMRKTSIGKTFELINSAIFVYFTASISIYYLSNYLTHYNGNIVSFLGKTVSYIWIFNSTLSAGMYTCFIIAIRKHLINNEPN